MSGFIHYIPPDIFYPNNPFKEVRS